MNAADTPRISVCVPLYGVEAFVGTCAESLFSQRDADRAEFLFVDDASPDASVARLERVAARYPALAGRIRILHHPTNRGLAAARRTALAAARGEWVLHVDSDDRLLPDALARLLEAADRHPGADIVYGGYLETPDPETPGGRIVPVPDWGRDRILRELVAQTYRIPNRIWGLLIRRSLYRGMEEAGVDFAEDYAVTPRLIHAARAVVVLPEPLYAYRTTRDGSYMKRLDDRAARQYVAAQQAVVRYLRRQREWPALRDAAALGRLNIGKWILKRGLDLRRYEAALFEGDPRPRLAEHRLYRAALRSGSATLARLAGLLANALFARRAPQNPLRP